MKKQTCDGIKFIIIIIIIICLNVPPVIPIYVVVSSDVLTSAWLTIAEVRHTHGSGHSSFLLQLQFRVSDKKFLSIVIE